MSLRALQGPTGGGAPVGGSGTSSPSTIPRWTGASTLGDSGLIDDGSQIYTTSRVLAVNTATTLGTGLIRFQVGSASALANYQGAQAGFMLPAGSGSWVEFCENSTSGTTFRISKDASTGVVLNANGKNMGFNASGYTTAVASSQMVLLTSGNVGISVTPISPLHVKGNATNTDGILTLTPNTGGRNHQVQSLQASSLFRIFDQSAGVSRLEIDINGNISAATTGGTFNASTSGAGLKLPATPGNADTQTLDAYQEIGTGTPAEIALTLTCGTSGTITVNAASSKARVTRVGNKVIGHGRIVVSSVSAPLGRLSCTLTGCPQPFTFFVCETRTNDTTGVPSGNIIVGTSDTSATPIVYFDRYSPNTRNDDAAANIQAGTTIVFSFSYSV